MAAREKELAQTKAVGLGQVAIEQNGLSSAAGTCIEAELGLVEPSTKKTDKKRTENEPSSTANRLKDIEKVLSESNLSPAAVRCTEIELTVLDLTMKDAEKHCTENGLASRFRERELTVLDTSMKDTEECTIDTSNGKTMTRTMTTMAMTAMKTETKTTELGKRARDAGKKHKPNKSERRRVAMYGNYYHYYGYRVLEDSDGDPRLKYFKREWFEGKDCLDVGCNAGNLTISMAKKFLCKTMVGVDIDRGLVGRANKLLEKTAKSIAQMHRQQRSGMKNEEIASNNTSSSSKLGNSDFELSSEELLERVSFRAENFITHLEVKPTYDTVLCLSVTKWVHLNWGDDGLLRLLAKIRDLLRPGGILILEPQPWESYRNKHLISEVARQNYHEIVLYPHQFKEILLDKIGFRLMECITEKIESRTKGFNRPMYLLRC